MLQSRDRRRKWKLGLLRNLLRDLAGHAAWAFGERAGGLGVVDAECGV